MKLTIDLSEDEIINLVCWYISRYQSDLGGELNKTQIKEMATEAALYQAQGIWDWSEGMEDYESAQLNGWVTKQVKKYKI